MRTSPLKNKSKASGGSGGGSNDGAVKHLVEIDVSGRCTDAGGVKGNDTFNSGSTYRIDLENMTQTSSRGFSRKIIRVVDKKAVRDMCL